MQGDGAAAYERCERLRWGDAEPICPHCGGDRSYFLQPTDGRSRRTRAGGSSARRVWKCAQCRRQFSVLTGTVLHATKVPLPVWIAVADDWASDARVPTPSELVHQHRISRDAARRMCRLLTLAGGVGAPGLATLLAVTEPAASRIRDASAVRRRPRPEAGPSADYGSGSAP